jgi:hypothetical protein
VSDLAIKHWIIKIIQEKLAYLRENRMNLVQNNAKDCHLKVCDKEILMAANALLVLNQAI